MGRGWWSGWGRRSQRRRVGADAERRDHLYCNSGALWISLRAAPGARFTFSLCTVPSFVFHLSAFTCTYSYATKPLLIFALPFSCCLPFMFAYDGGSRFMRSLSIFHDSVFYCLYESFYPAFLLAVAPETFSCAPLHSTCSIFYHRDFRFLSFDFLLRSFASFLRLSIS